MRFAAGVEYDGTAYSGWQIQAHAPSVQAHVERALSLVAAHPLSVVAAGRTDAGVHASHQVIHFDTQARRSQHGWLLGGNVHLPADINRYGCVRSPAIFTPASAPALADIVISFSIAVRAPRYTVIGHAGTIIHLMPRPWRKGPPG